jgi:hypothetical protein
VISNTSPQAGRLTPCPCPAYPVVREFKLVQKKKREKKKEIRKREKKPPI